MIKDDKPIDNIKDKTLQMYDDCLCLNVKEFKNKYKHEWSKINIYNIVEKYKDIKCKNSKCSVKFNCFKCNKKCCRNRTWNGCTNPIFGKTRFYY